MEAEEENLSARLKKLKNKSKTVTPKKKKSKLSDNKIEEEEDNGEEKDAVDGDKRVCELCDGAFARVSFKNHQERDHRHPCPSCDKRFVVKVFLF